MAASQIQGQLDSKINYLETDLLESKQGSAAKSSEVESLLNELKTVQKSLIDTTMNMYEHSAGKELMQKEMEKLSAVRRDP